MPAWPCDGVRQCQLQAAPGAAGGVPCPCPCPGSGCLGFMNLRCRRCRPAPMRCLSCSILAPMVSLASGAGRGADGRCTSARSVTSTHSLRPRHATPVQPRADHAQLSSGQVTPDPLCGVHRAGVSWSSVQAAHTNHTSCRCPECLCLVHLYILPSGCAQVRQTMPLDGLAPCAWPSPAL